MRTRIVVITLIGILLLTVGCSAPWSSTPSPSRSGPSSVKITPSVKPAGNKITVPVDASHVLNVEIPDVGHLSGPTGAFTGSGSITIQPEKASFASSSPFQTSGAGMDVAFDGTSLRQPLTLAFDASTRPSANAVPLVAHQGDDGQWNFLPATLDSSGRITVQTSSFSVNIPGWGIADAIFHAIGNFLASGIGGRTSPLTCTGAPKWFHLDLLHSDLVHACATTNHTSSGQLVAEVQIKSNRGVSLEVTVPGDPTYVWVDGQPWPERQEVGSFLHFDPNRTVILGAGQTMTVGYTQWATSLPVSFFVTGATPLAFIDTLTGDVFNSLMPGGFSDYINIAYTEVQCASSLRLNSLTGGFSLAGIGDYLKCMGSGAVTDLSDPQTALNVVLKFGGSGENVDMIVKAAKALNFVGWIFTLWPYFQAGWGNIIDKLNELLSNGESALVTWHMDPPVPTNGNGGTQTNPPVTVTTGTGNPNPSNPTVTLAQGPVVSGGAYRYAITLSGFPANATVSVECYDSVSPSGFYNFGLTTDSSGNGFTQSQCYSGDGLDHWVVANGITSNHVQWGGTSSPPPPPPPPPPPTTYSETTGGAAHTWTDYTNAGGTQGPTIPAYQTVEISCKVTGFKVADGNTWWYRIASAPWSNAYYVSADAFYNNGATSGPLKGTPFVDPAVPNC